MMKITVLGCGGSHGVPLVGNRWGACDPDNPRNRRRRPSVFVESDGVNILIDTGPDLRAQLLDAEIDRIDAVLYTHAHADHTHGIDDIRSIARTGNRRIPAYAEPDVMKSVQDKFSYIFNGSDVLDSLYPATLEAHTFDGPFEVEGCRVVPFDQDHGICRSTGFRIGPFAYSTDVVDLDESAFEVLDGVEIWIVDCLRERPHPTHAHLEKTLSWIERVGPRRAIMTHMNHQTDYETFAAKLPDGVEPGFDGMVIEIED